jgi:hypothetical protein
MAEYMRCVAAERLFVWPNFVDSDIFHDYGERKIIPVLVTGSHALHYPWRNRISKLISQHFPTLSCPHFGWFDAKAASRTIFDDPYARLINASYIVPTCGTIAKEVVRKHFEIPGCNSCLITEETQGLKAAGFADMKNCVFATEGDVLDKIDYLFKNDDVLEAISREGYQLVQSRHTLKQRDQLLQWLKLYKKLQPNEKIVQTAPFGSLGIVDRRSGISNGHTFSNGIDRLLLREGDAHLHKGRYRDAEKYYIRCLNFHFMPEPILGLTLCNLYIGDSRAALKWVAKAINATVTGHRTASPDPVEWAYLIVSILCQGEVAEATRRAHQFPFLDHRELARCRSVIGVLSGANSGSSPLNESGASAGCSFSVHELPERDMITWCKELCKMLRACGQVRLAEQLENAGSGRSAQTAMPSFPRAGRQTLSFRGSNKILSPAPEPFVRKVGRHLPLRMRTALRPLVSAVQSRRNPAHESALGQDEFLLAVQTRAREQPARSAVIWGASSTSIYTRAFLDGIRQNPSSPLVLCLAASGGDARKLEEQFAGDSSTKMTSGAASAAKRAAGIESFDMVLIDGCVSEECDALEALTGAKTVLIRDIDTHLGYLITSTLVSNSYIVEVEKLSAGSRYAIFSAQFEDSNRLVMSSHGNNL